MIHIRVSAATVVALIVLLTPPSSVSADPLPTVRVSASGRFLETSTGQPFFWMGDTAWSLYRLNPTELDQYFADRVQKEFNVIQGPLLLSPEANYQGVTNTNPTSPNEQWFAHIDLAFNKAQQHGLYIAPVLAWGDQHQMFTMASAYQYGFYIGNRYKNQTNIAAFIVAGEFNHPAPNVDLWTQLAQGLLDGLAPHQRLLTAHPRWYGIWGGQSTSDDLHHAPWLSFNMIQSAMYGDCTNDPTHLYYLGTHNWLLLQNDYALTPIKPTFDGEATYEMQSPLHPSCQFNPERWDDFGVRRRAYWSVFAGGFGHTYGANGVFQFHKSYDPNPTWSPLHFWDEAIHYPGAQQMRYLRRLIQSRPFYTRVPGQDLLIAPHDELVPTHIHATRDSAGRYAMVYVPNANRTITVNMNLIGGQTKRAWWYRPTSGEPTLIGTFTAGDYPPSGALDFTTPASGPDWVLVVDDASQNFPAPGGSRPGDVNGDGVVNVSDLLAVINGWGPCPAPPQPCPADIAPYPAGDGVVNVSDLLLVINNWG